MERALRSRHRLTWLLLGPVLVAAAVALLLLRPPIVPVADAGVGGALADGTEGGAP